MYWYRTIYGTLIFGSQKISKLLLILLLFIKKLFTFIYQYIVLILFFYEKLDIIDFYIFQCYFMVIFLFNFSNFLQKNYLYRNTDNSTIIIFYIKVEFPTYKLYIYILISYEPYNK